jgi:hypothetical protein
MVRIALPNTFAGATGLEVRAMYEAELQSTPRALLPFLVQGWATGGDAASGK